MFYIFHGDFLRTTLTFSIRDAKQSQNGVLADRCGVADDRQLGDKSMMKILMVTMTMLCRTKLIMVIFWFLIIMPMKQWSAKNKFQISASYFLPI